MEVLLKLVTSKQDVHQRMIGYLSPIGHELVQLVPLAVLQRRYAFHLCRAAAISLTSPSGT